MLRAAIGISGPVEPTAEDWSTWLSVARTERVMPQLHRVVSGNVRTTSPSPEYEQATVYQLDVAALCVSLEQSLLEVASVLDDADVRYAVLKGGATAHLDYGDPSDRQFGDVDLLVDPSTFARARSALERSGWRQAYALPRHHEQFTHAVTIRAAGRISEIDLHQHIAHRALGLSIPTAELLTCRVPLDIAGRQLWALKDADRLIHGSIHMVASRGGYRRLSSVADVLVLGRRLEERAAEVLDRAETWRVRPLVEVAVHDAHREASLPLPEAWATAMRRPMRRRDRLVELAYLGERRRPAIEEIAYLRVMPSWRDRFLYLYGHLRMDAGPGSGGLRKRLRYLRSRLRQRA